NEKALVWDENDETLGKEYKQVAIPADLRDQVKEYREKMIEGLAEVDEHLMEKYVHGEAITADELKKAVRKGTIAMTLFPVLCVYSGQLPSGSAVYNSTKDKKERVGRLLRMHANKREEIDGVAAGDIAAVIGLKATTTGDTLCDPDKPIVLESMSFPDPVIAVAIEPKTKADEEKLGVSLSRLAPEDPTFRVTTEQETSQTLIHGMGELHLEIIVD